MGNSYCGECISAEHSQGAYNPNNKWNSSIPGGRINKMALSQGNVSGTEGPPVLSPQVIKVIEEQTKKTNKQTMKMYNSEKKAHYEGEYSKGLPEGYGKVIYDNGAYFQGYFKAGEAKCQDGLYVYPDGSFYRGNILRSQAHGKGIMQQADGDLVYVGEWAEDKPEGEGKQLFKDGSYYKGRFSQGLKHGEGRFVWADKSYYKGQFKNGAMDGFGKQVFRDGSIYEGPYVKNKMEGKGQLSSDEGVYVGDFFQGRKHGFGQYHYKDGKVYLGEFVNGKPHGRGKIYFATGQTTEGEWKNGENVAVTKIGQESLPRTIETFRNVQASEVYSMRGSTLSMGPY